MKENFQKKAFWVILVILLLAVFVYPPWIGTSWINRGSYGQTIGFRVWSWIFSYTEWDNQYPIGVDFKMILLESTIAILLSIGVCLFFFNKKGKKKV